MSKQGFVWSSLFILFAFLQSGRAKIDIIELEDDPRDFIYLVSYGMFKDGFLDVRLSFTFKPVESTMKTKRPVELKNFGLTIDKTHQSSAQTAQYGSENKERSCVLRDPIPDSKMIRLTFTEDNEVNVIRGSEMSTVVLSSFPPSTQESSPTITSEVDNSNKTVTTSTITTTEVNNLESNTKRRKRAAVVTPSNNEMKKNENNKTRTDTTPKPVILSYKLKLDQEVVNISVMFRVEVGDKSDAGLYSIYFHNCQRQPERLYVSALHANITGRNLNPSSYLSAGDIPEPYVFFTVSVVYMILAFIWIRVLRAASSGVYKTHYLMLIVLFCKSISAVFHGMNYYYIGLKGKEETAWAVIYYITYLMKTVMLFLTIFLVGSGWIFIKHIFSEKEKKLFLIAIPLQVLLYVSHVIMSETEVAAKTYSTWLTLSYIVDVLCCAAILVPVYWSIKHLEEASRTNGKVAINLQKLKLFKTLYMTIIAYIYITRLIITVLSMTVPFSMSYLRDLFLEGTVLLFLIIWGYKFRPADDNPYFQIPPDSDDEQDEEVELIVTQNLKTTEAKKRQKVTDDPEKHELLERNESSHELD